MTSPTAADLVEALCRDFPGVAPQDFSFTLMKGGTALRHRADQPIYPASVIKLFYMVAAAQLAEAGKLLLDAEDERAIAAMIRRSSNNATGYVMDRIAGCLGGAWRSDDYDGWKRGRLAVQAHFDAWNWPELTACRILHSTYDDSPYGFEQHFRHEAGPNCISTDAVARLMSEVGTGKLAGTEMTRRMLDWTSRDEDRLTPGGEEIEEFQVGGFFAQAFPKQCRCWTKAGWTSRTRHDAALLDLPDGSRIIMVAFTEGSALAENQAFLPAFARRALAFLG